MSTSVLKPCLVNLISKDTHLAFSIYAQLEPIKERKIDCACEASPDICCSSVPVILEIKLPHAHLHTLKEHMYNKKKIDIAL